MFFQSLFRRVLDHPILVLVSVVILVAASTMGAQYLTFNNDYRMFFSEENPQLQAFEELQDTYTKNDNVLIVLSPDDKNVFSKETMSAVAWLTEQSWQIPYSIRVDSLTNYQHTYAEGDDLVVEDLVEDVAGTSLSQFEQKKQIAINEPLLQSRLVNEDGSITAVNVTVQLPGKALSEVPEIAAFVRDLEQQINKKYPNITTHMTGMVMMNNSFPEASQGDVKTLYPIMLLIIIVVVGLMLKSIPGTIVTLVVILMTILTTMGLSGWAGIVLSPPTTSVPVVIMTLAIADCVHILVTFLHQMRDGQTKYKAMKESLRINLGPVFLTSITTAIGFLSLNFSDAPPFRDLGNMSAAGVMVAFFLSVTLLPALMMLLPVKTKQRQAKSSVYMIKLADFVIQNKTQLLIVMGLVIAVLVSQIPRNHMNDEFVKYFDETIDFRQDTDYTTENLTGIYRIEYSVPAKESGGVSDPEYLANLEKFSQWFRQQPRVLHVNTLTDIMKRLNRDLHEGKDEWYKVPDDRELSAQYLLLYEFSLPFGLDLNNQINVDKSATRLTITMESVSSRELIDMEEKAQEWMKQNWPEYMWADGSSPSVMFAHIGQRNIYSMLVGTSVALVLISLILVFALRSWRLGMLSLIPNLVPMGMAFGLWGMLVGQVGLALSVVTGMTLGIVVDDTVHFLSKYLRAKREKGLSSEDAVRYAFKTVGTALWVTSVVLMIGFSVLAMSHFELNAGMGLLTAITIGLALVADFLFLPPILMKFGDQKNV